MAEYGCRYGKKQEGAEEVKIMKVHLKQIPAVGIHLEGKEEHDILELEDDQVHPIGTVEYSLDIGVSRSGLFATGEIGADFELVCVSCLKRFVYPVRIRNFAAQVELTGTELVDLTPWLREDILLALPAHAHCDWDRKTVCVGPRFEHRSVERQSNGSNAWDILDDLKLKRRN
jgi:uncharacterized metal-binding protein YceD (DUF177 family)